MAVIESVHTTEDRSWPPPRRKPVMRMQWHDLLFMHYRADARLLQGLLPAGVEIDTIDGEAWIGVVPFRMSGVAPRILPDLPFVSRFPELNVRTYVTVNGRPGVWFFSLDATSKIAVRGARWLFHLKYLDAKIALKKSNADSAGSWFDYRCVRTDRSAPAAKLHCEYRPMGDWFFARPGTLVHWLTARYCLYTASRSGQIYRGEINHEPWRLRDAQAIVHENTMTDWLGIDLSGQKPLLHFSKSTKVVAWSLDEVSNP